MCATKCARRGGARRAAPGRRGDVEGLNDVLAASEVITAHLERGDLSDGLVHDVVRLRLFEIGEALKEVDDALLGRASRRHHGRPLETYATGSRVRPMSVIFAVHPVASEDDLDDLGL